VLLLLLSLIFSQPSFALGKVVFELKESSTQYIVEHPAHTVESTSKSSRGKIECDEKMNCQYLVAVPVKSFDSGSSGRDQHMLEVTRASLHPMVQIKGQFKLVNSVEPSGQIEAVISFAGEERKYDNLLVNWKKDGKIWHASGAWTLKFTDFKIERPALLLVPVKEEFQINFSQTWAEL
jgi:hypothetical protein